MLLEIHLLCFFALTVHGKSTPNQENAIDLLAALNMSHHVTGVARQHSSNSVVYKIRSRAPHLTLSLEYSHFLYSNLKGGIGVYLVGRQASRSTATVFSLSSGSSPILQIISSTLNDTLHVEYLTRGKPQGLTSFQFPRRNPFSSEEWVKLAVSLEPGRVVFFVDCQEAAVLLTKSEERVNLELPQDVVITIASTPGKKESKFNGYFKKAEISLKPYQRRPWICLNHTDVLPLHADTPNPDSQIDVRQLLRPSKRQAKFGPEKPTNHRPHNIQSDQMQRGTVLGPPGLKPVAQAQREDRLRRLERRIEDLVQMLDMVKTQNADLQTRVNYLEGCECVRQRCVWEGREMHEGQKWQIDVNTLCSCTSGKVTCQANIKSGDPCLSNPCQNGGTCFILTSDPPGFHCSCPPNTKGPMCHKQQRQACWAPKPENNCETEKPIHRRWAFNPSSGLCEDFLYCSGNSSNNFPSFNACRERCMLGACCLRKPIQGQATGPVHYVQDEYHISVNRTAWENDKLNLEAEIWYTEINLTDKSPKRLNHHKSIHTDFIYTCDYLTLTQCQELMWNQVRGTQVVSFSPGVKCSDMRCDRGCGRFSQCKVWQYKKIFRQGRKDNICTHSGVECICKHLIQRKEIRDLTLRERQLYQRAIRKLYNRPGCQPDGTIQSVSYNPGNCQPSSCKGDTRDCSPEPCPSRDCPTESTPGNCRSCIHFGVQYENGVEWRPLENPCDVCHCVEGRVRCERERCDTPCKNPTAPPPNSCCPVCNGCGVNGHDFANGAVVPTGDRCQQCTCVNGDVACSPQPCPALLCRNPVHHSGDCCPRCEECEYESAVYENGQNFLSTRDPCVRCHCSAGEVSCERMDTSCPKPGCSHPVTRKGECCPTCDECELDRRVYADGKSFTPPGSGPCLQCRCQKGNVICHDEKCPAVHCSNPIVDPHRCCPTCKACVSEGLEYEEGSQWQPDGPCSSCTCVNGETICSQTRCPANNCQHPTKAPDRCCADCESCTYNNRIYSNGQRFTTPDNPCHICTCQHGTVQCEREPCPQLNCDNPYTPPGECCHKCPDCSFENRVFVDGEAFPNPVSECEECRCRSGRIDCHQPQCPQPRCNAPLPGPCCRNNCNGCSYAGKEYPNGQEFPHPTDKCRMCKCTNGNVQCLKSRCPPLPCFNPNVVPDNCCPQCPAPPADCVYERQSYRHNEHFLHPTDRCQSCTCTDGTVQCQRKPCAFASCSHPTTQDCCRSCEGCRYDGRERANGETWNDASDPCAVCVCNAGSVRCERRSCPPANCNHPVRRQCCMSCDGCLFEGKEYPDGTDFMDEKDPCSVCHCYRGEVTCALMSCQAECSHPYRGPGQCCGECDRCFYNSAVLLNGQSIPDPGNPCSECTCKSGTVRCVSRLCPPTQCPHPVPDACGCPVCDGCYFQGVTYADGQTFSDGERGCQQCRCSRGEVVCSQRRCPPASCSQPAVDSCGCGNCNGCNYNGRDCFNGEQFQHPTDPCQQCSCQNGHVACAMASCAGVSCEHPVTPPGQCCPVCTGACFYEGKEYQSGSTFKHPSDRCSSCTCLNEVVNCHRRPCSVQCSHPAPSDDCCPVCDSCLYENVVYSHGQNFKHPSDPCMRCTCNRGTVTCSQPACAPTPCPRPITRPGQCCPECPVCMQEGQEFHEGQAWTMKSNQCSTCTCQTGAVRCASPECPKLNCMHQVTDPGQCCPRCRGCMYGGEEHAEGSTWFADFTPCMTCMCVDGVATCSEVRCLSPCNNVISVPGECCPMCADCVFEGRVYGPGDSFHPADDPCQICTCEVMPDGQQHLKCYRKQCPSLVDCPRNSILLSGPDSCCPVCAQPLSNCTGALIGNEVLATDDPCFSCQCKDLTWTCIHQNCPLLNCPYNDQITPPDSCCPVCKESGASCLYQGTVYHSNEQWGVDECTSCTCVSGDVHCQSERCPPLTCATDEMPAVIPGLCCPHCIPRPASCIAFGDPHYRTFDGRMLHFQGTCTYVLAQDCENGDFSIHVTNEDRGRKGVSWTKEATVFIGDVSVKLLQDWMVKVNDEVVTLPFLKEPYIYVERQTNTILLNTNIGFKVLWSPRSHLEVSVPGSYKGHTCGLCGNFNNYHQDDLRKPSGGISQSESDFGNSWRVTNGSHSVSRCRPGTNVDPCRDAGYQAKKAANNRCKILKSAVFKPCHRVVPPEPWYGACVYDLCACGSNTDECLCDTLEAYASQCREAGVILQWRSASLCAVGCPVERGFVFDECGPPCPVTCFNVDVPLGVIESHCFKPCVPGCQCPAGLVLHNNYCIKPEKCPKIIHGSP